MTLGERIQELRNRDGLSQELLGEKLGVSRQAISKWEGDVTIPEVEKLVALSRLFGINVGVLLGVEEPAADGEDAPLNERELAAVEAVAARYVPTLPRWLPIGAALLCVAALAIGLVWNIVMAKTLEDYKNQTDSSLAALRGQISLLQIPPSTVVTTPAEDFFSAQICEVDGVDIDAGTATLRLSVTPKRFVEGTAAQFTVTGQDISAITTPPQTADGQTFSSVVTVPLDDKLAVTAAIKDGDTTETRLLGEFFDLKKESGITLNTWWEESGVAAMEITTGRNAVPPDEAALRVYQEGQLVNTYPIVLRDETTTVPPGAPVPIYGGTTTYYIYPKEKDNSAQFVAWVKDTEGREYTAPVETYLVK